MNLKPIKKEQGIVTPFTQAELAATNFIPAEITLENIGYFIPSTTRKSTREVKHKKITTRNHQGREIELKVDISPSVKHGLPVTIDFDYYRAFQKIFALQNEQGIDPKEPIRISSYQLIKEARKAKGTQERKNVMTFLDRLTETNIVGVSLDPETGVKTRINTSPFSQVVQKGQVLPNGAVAETNYIWLSDFYLGNIFNGNVKSLHYELHFQLNNPLAKALYPPLLSGWYATNGRAWCKSYHALCDEFLLTRYTKVSDIKRQFAKASKELKHWEIIEDFELTKARTKGDYNLTFTAGTYFFLFQKELKSRRDKKTRAINRNEAGKKEDLYQRILEVTGDEEQSGGNYRKLIKEKPRAVIEEALSITKDTKARGNIRRNEGATLQNNIERLAAQWTVKSEVE